MDLHDAALTAMLKELKPEKPTALVVGVADELAVLEDSLRGRDHDAGFEQAGLRMLLVP